MAYVETLKTGRYRIRGGAPGPDAYPGDLIEERRVRIGDRVFEFTRIQWALGADGVTILVSHEGKVPFRVFGVDVDYELAARD